MPGRFQSSEKENAITGTAKNPAGLQADGAGSTGDAAGATKEKRKIQQEKEGSTG